ncbi:MAG: trehalose-phosphatase [Acidimicrobiales bacterium]
MATLDARWAPFLTVPAAAAVLCDFDGTLAPIVEVPELAKPLDGVTELLGALAARFGVVAVVSGRPVTFLQRFLPASVALSGLYGLEVVREGRREDHPLGGAWREVVDDVVATSRASGPAGMRVEPKGLSLTLHFRGAPMLEPEVREWAEREARRSGLAVRSARMSLELHPPIAADKGTAVRDLAASCRAVCFLGDDSGDLPAFDALDELAASGVAAMRVGVRSEEAPPELLGRADVVVDGPVGVAALLASLLRTEA